MKLDLNRPWLLLGIVLAWRFVLLLLTKQPVPANDAFLFDGAVANWLLHGQYFNPSLAECFPISGHQVFSAYPPIYQVLLLPWMSVFGTSALSAMWFHFAWFCVAGIVLVILLRVAFPGKTHVSLAVLFLFAVTFDDRPDGVAHVFGLSALLLCLAGMRARANRPAAQIGEALILFCSLYTSLIVGAFYCGVTILTGVVGWLLARRASFDAQEPSPSFQSFWPKSGCELHSASARVSLPWISLFGVVILFTAATVWIAGVRPVWWQGFLENARQTPVSTAGFRLPQPTELIKIIRNAPVFLLALACASWWWKKLRRPAPGGRIKKERTANGARNPEDPGLLAVDLPSMSLTVAVMSMGLALLLGALTLFTANYVNYLWYAQVLLAAGLLGSTAGLRPRARRLFHAGLAGCLVLVSVRAAGMTTWGVLCAKDVSYARAKDIVRGELQPLVNSGARPVVSSAFLYEATALGVRGAIHSDWPYDRRRHPPGSDLALMNRLRPPKLVLTQFDYYRVYAPIVAEFQRHPELCSVRVRNTAALPAPDSFPSMQRVLQHVSWAPVIVDFSWNP